MNHFKIATLHILKLTGEGIANDLRSVLESLTPQFEIDINRQCDYVLCVAHDRA